MIKKHFAKRKYDYLSLGVILLMTTLLLAWVYQWGSIRHDVPLVYEGSDAISSLVNAKLFDEQFWSIDRPRLGAPYGTNAFDFSTCVFHNFDLFTLKICVMAGDAAVGYNLNIYLTYYLLAIIAWLVLRELKIGRIWSVAGAIAFAFTPYVTARIGGHTNLAQAYFVPLSVLLCIWLYEREEVFALRRDFFKIPRNWWAILFIILIANNGIIYYPFFTCYLLLVVAIIKWIQTGRFKAVFRYIGAIGGIGLVLVINMIPKLLYNMANGSNGSAVVRGGFTGAELYGLKLSQLFIPIEDKLNIIQDRIDSYNETTPFVTENFTSYMGLIAIIGFFVILAYFFVKNKDELTQRMRFLGQLNLMMVFLAAGNGIGTIFAFLVTGSIRGYCRISIFIVFVSIIGFGLFMDKLSKQFNVRAVMAAGLIVVAFGIWEQTLTYEKGEIAITQNYDSDKAFVEEIEAREPKGSMIYQMPYHPYPEAGGVNGMMDYDLFAGFLHSQELRWSYGGMKGREADKYNSEVAELPLAQRIDRIYNDGFAGIYVDRRAYTTEELGSLETQLAQLTGDKGMISNNGCLSYFSLENYKGN